MLSVSDPWYDLLRSGVKTLEGRLWTPSKRNFVDNYLNKIITINRNENPTDSFSAILIDYHLYSSFREALYDNPTRLLPGVPSIKEGIKVYRQYFSEADEKHQGVVLLEIKVL